MNFLYTLKAPSPMFSVLVITGVLLIVFVILYFIIKKVDYSKETPKWLVPFLWIVDLINSLTRTNIGKRWKSYAPWFLTITIFIFFSNISAVFLLDNPTGYLIVTATLALTTFVMIQLTGMRSLGMKAYLKGFLDPFPILLPMNIISELSLPISLALRLFGNITSGTAISILIKNILDWPMNNVMIVVMPFINLIFDLFSGVIQVTVFLMLSMVFTSNKVKDEEKIYSE